MADLVTPKQLVAIRVIANRNALNAETECLEQFKLRPEELSKRGASAFIDRLKAKAEKLNNQRNLVRLLTDRLTTCAMADYNSVKATLGSEQAKLKAMETA
jgi:hypothetical protein